MKSFGALRALARVELRELGRNRARSSLVALLVAVPVAALVGGSALFETTRPTLEERRTEAMGSAALRVEAIAPDELRAQLPHDAEAIALLPLELESRDGLVAAPGLALDLDGLAAGMLRLVSGRAPSNAAEIALSPALLAATGAALGQIVRSSDGVSRELVGVVVSPEATNRPLALLAPVHDERARRWLVDLPAERAPELATRLRERGAQVLLREEIVPGDGFEELVLFVVGGFGFFEAALVVAAAFAVGVRRRQREIGLLGASGAAAADVRTAIVVSAAVLALLGCALGLAVGLGAAALLHPLLDGWNARLNGALELSAPHALGALFLGVGSAALAAVLPARGVARMPVRVALSGRRPVAGRSRGWLFVGAGVLLAGLALMAFGASRAGGAAGVGILAGSVLAVLGLGALSPWLLAVLARGAGPLPLAWRLAVRDAGRFRARNGPVVTAVLAALSVSVLAATMVQSIARSLDARQLEQGPERAWIYVLLALCVSTGLVVVLIATALSSVESAADARVLHTVGASPALLRAHAAARAGYLALLGCTLAIPAGLVPAVGLMRLADVELELSLPWPEIVAALFLLPATAFAVTWCAAVFRARPVPIARSLD